MNEENFKTERQSSDKGLPKVGRSWEEEAQHLSSTFLTNVKSDETAKAVVKLIEENKKDPAVVAFGQKHAQIMVFLNVIFDLKISDPVEKLKFIGRYLEENPGYIKAIAEFSDLSEQMDRKYQLPGVALNLAPLFQWIPKIQLHLEAKKNAHGELMTQFQAIANSFQDALKIMDLEKLFKEKGPDPFNAFLPRRRREAYAQIKTCEPKHVAEFLIKHKDDHPEYAKAFFRKARWGDTNFLKKFDEEHDHRSLKRLYAVSSPKSSVGLFTDIINKAYRYRMETRLSLDECIKKLSDSEIPKTLQNALVAKMKGLSEQTFLMPTAKEMNSFLEDVKEALKSPEGLGYSAYLKIVTSDKKPASRTAMFGLERNVFENSKVFKAQPNHLAPVAPPRVSTTRPASQVKPQRS